MYKTFVCKVTIHGREDSRSRRYGVAANGEPEARTILDDWLTHQGYEEFDIEDIGLATSGEAASLDLSFGMVRLLN